jgi:hypothetical protein
MKKDVSVNANEMQVSCKLSENDLKMDAWRCKNGCK